MQIHHGKHHQKYVDSLNELIKGTSLAKLSLVEIIHQTANSKYPGALKIFQNAAQHWNHSFFWKCLTPSGGGKPIGACASMIVRDFGSQEAFRDEFHEKGLAHFGSGWVWLVRSDGKLEVVTTHDADTPLSRGQQALLCCDLWEHAYYLDYQNSREDFLNAFLDHLVNWEFINNTLLQDA